MRFLAARLGCAASLLLGSPLARADEASKTATAPATVSPPAPAAPAGPAKVQAPIWSGSLGGFSIDWNSAGLDATDAKGSTVFSAAPLVQTDFKDFDDSCDKSETWELLSVVGTVLSMKQSVGATCEGAAHPSANTSIVTVDLREPAKAPTLAAWFSEADLYAALAADGVVKKTLAAANLPAPKSSAGLLKLLSDNSNECEFRFEEDSLTHFAFHHLEKGKVAVRIGLPYGCEAARGNLTWLGLLLPVPEKLKPALEAAAARKQGFLMKDEKAVAKGGVAEFHADAVAAPAQ